MAWKAGKECGRLADEGVGGGRREGKDQGAKKLSKPNHKCWMSVGSCWLASESPNSQLSSPKQSSSTEEARFSIFLDQTQLLLLSRVFGAKPPLSRSHGQLTHREIGSGARAHFLSPERQLLTVFFLCMLQLNNAYTSDESLFGTA